MLMLKPAYLMLCLTASLLLAGCLQQSTSPEDAEKIASLEAKVESLDAKCSALEKDNAALEASAKAGLKAKGECEASLAQAQGAQEKLGRLAEVEVALLPLTNVSEAEKKTATKYAELDFFACRYYLSSGGFFTGGNVTIPIGCVLIIDAYISASKTYFDELNQSRVGARTALKVVGEIKAG